MTTALKRAAATFLSRPDCHRCHRIRMVLKEKAAAVEIEHYKKPGLPSGLADINPYNTLPTLIDRDLALYETRVIMEYLDERFPHPPLLPGYPVERAQCRLWMHRIESDWCPMVDRILDGKGSADDVKNLGDSIISISPVFVEHPFFMNDDFSLVDCCVAPILWRLAQMGIELPSNRQTKPLLEYMNRIFARTAFTESLSEYECYDIPHATAHLT